MSLGDMMTLLKLRRGQYSLVEEKIPAGAQAVGMAIKDLPMPPNAVIAAIIRRGEIVIPRGVTRFEVGDEVLAVVDPEGADDLAALFTPPGARPFARITTVVSAQWPVVSDGLRDRSLTTDH